MSFPTSQEDIGTSISDAMLNDDLELTPQQEIKRLKRVILEKDAAIKAFKEYDKKRSEEFNRLTENYNLMQQQFDQFCEDVKEIDEIDELTKEDFDKIYHSYYKRMGALNDFVQFINEVRNRLSTLEDFACRLEADARKFKENIQKFKDSIDKKKKEWKK